MASDGESGQVVVVGVDGSDPSVSALSWASRYAAATGATVRATWVWHYPTAAGLPPGKTPEPITAEVEERIRAELSGAVTKAKPDPSARIETKLVYGHPAEALIDESRGQSLLVVGHRGHGGFTEVLTGSISIHCINHAACPVVVVRGS
jgi:nucleotide-binding universal stress UspA family protein